MPKTCDEVETEQPHDYITDREVTEWSTNRRQPRR